MTRKEKIELAWLGKAVQSNHRYDERSFKEAFSDGVEWMLEKSTNWFYKNAHKTKYWDEKGYLLIHVLMDDYKRAMEK